MSARATGDAAAEQLPDSPPEPAPLGSGVLAAASRPRTATIASPVEEAVVTPLRAPARPGWPHRLHARLVRWQAAADRFRERAPRLVAAARIAFYPAALALVVFMGYQAARGLRHHHVNWPAAGGAFLTALVWWLSLAYGWANLVTEKFDHGQVGLWCRTQVTRYLPGGIWAPVTRATQVRGRVRDKVAAVAAENIIQLCCALAIGALWVTVHDIRWLPLVIVAATPLAAAGWLQRRTRVTRRGVTRAAAIYSVGWVCYGVSGLLAQIAVSGVRDPTYPLYVAGAACVAWAIGLVAVFAPSGVGVREVVYIWFLSSLYPRPGLEGGAVLLRLITIAAELVVLAVVGLPLVRPRPAAAADPDRG